MDGSLLVSLAYFSTNCFVEEPFEFWGVVLLGGVF